jgi:hypothetical protein
MKWQKKGVIFKTDSKHEWNQLCARVPVVDVLSDKVWRIYYGSQNTQFRGSIGYFDVEAENPKNILYIHDKPVLSRGELGTFDELGVMPSFVINENNRKYFYYIGYNVTKTLPYHNGIGLAIWNDETQMFERISQGPLFERTLKEPFFNASSCVLKEGKLWRLWYLSTTKWTLIDNKAEPSYHIKYAESTDGINWQRNAVVAIDYKDETEGGIARPMVIKQGDLYRMWYAYRKLIGYKTDKNSSYRIGYAESLDGINWTRMDEKAGIDLSPQGWDSEMICYPYVVKCANKLYMFYNGNGFGKTGIGYAELEI